MKKQATRLEIWNWIGFAILALYLVFLIFPLLGVLKASVITPEGFTMKYFSKFFGQKYYISTLFNSLKVALTTMIWSLLLGVPLAYFFNVYTMKGRKLIEVVIILCSMSAPFIGAYAWILLLGRNGLLTKIIEAILHVTIPSVYGFSGIVLVLTTRLFPLVFLYVSGALKSIDNTLLEASENLGCNGIRRFFKVVLPLCMPSILAAGLLVFMRALADFGTPLLIGEGYRTFPVEIYKQYVGEVGVDHNFASAISVVAVVITAMVFMLQKVMNNHFRFSINSLHPLESRPMKKFQAVFVYLYTYTLIAISFMPQLYLMYMSFRKTSASGSLFVPGYSLDSYRIALKKFSSAIPNTLLIGGIAVGAVLLLSILVAYLVVRRNSIISRTIDTFSMIPFVIPGSVVAIALILAFNHKPLVLTATMCIMIVSMVIRRAPYTIRSSVAILQQIPAEIEEAGISLGSSKIRTFFLVTVPMMKNGIISGGILSWITIITELSTSIILYTSHTVTMTLAIYIFVTRGTDGPAAAMATLLTVFTTVSLLIFLKFSKSDDLVM